MPQLIDGKQHPNPGISKETCDKMHRVSDGEVSPCKRKHREDVANITFDAYQEWMNNIHKPGTPDHTHLRFGQSFCNHFGVHDEGLYYETLPIVASHCIWTHYIVDEGFYKAEWDDEGRLT